jgi:hypothetical protein
MAMYMTTEAFKNNLLDRTREERKKEIENKKKKYKHKVNKTMDF